MRSEMIKMIWIYVLWAAITSPIKNHAITYNPTIVHIFDENILFGEQIFVWLETSIARAFITYTVLHPTHTIQSNNNIFMMKETSVSFLRSRTFSTAYPR